MNQFKLKSFLFLFIFLSSHAFGSCQNPAPPPMSTQVPQGSSCPFNYSQTGNTCSPSFGAARYFFVTPSGVGCPMTYSQEGQLCIANTNSCHAYFSGGGSCPSGYAMSGPVCISN